MRTSLRLSLSAAVSAFAALAACTSSDDASGTATQQPGAAGASGASAGAAGAGAGGAGAAGASAGAAGVGAGGTGGATGCPASPSPGATCAAGVTCGYSVQACAKCSYTVTCTCDASGKTTCSNLGDSKDTCYCACVGCGVGGSTGSGGSTGGFGGKGGFGGSLGGSSTGGAGQGGASGNCPGWPQPKGSSCPMPGVECTFGSEVSVCGADGWFTGVLATSGPLPSTATCDPRGQWDLVYTKGSMVGGFCGPAPEPDLEVRAIASGALIAGGGYDSVKIDDTGCHVTAKESSSFTGPESWTTSVAIDLTLSGDTGAGTYAKQSSGFCNGNEQGTLAAARK